MNMKLLAHSGFEKLAKESGVVSETHKNENPDFNTFIWQGGFILIVSNIIIAVGTILCVKWIFEEIKDTIKTSKNKIIK